MARELPAGSIRSTLPNEMAKTEPVRVDRRSDRVIFSVRQTSFECAVRFNWFETHGCGCELEVQTATLNRSISDVSHLKGRFVHPPNERL